jgi:hypothetical protein
LTFRDQCYDFFKIFSQKTARILAFLTQDDISFEDNRQFFGRKSVQIIKIVFTTLAFSYFEDFNGLPSEEALGADYIQVVLV